VLGPPTPTFPSVNELPSSGLEEDLEGNNGWSPWMIGGLALATSGAGLSLSARLLRNRRHGGPRYPGGGARLHRAPRRDGPAQAPASLTVRVTPVADFTDFVAVVRALNEIPAIEIAQALLLENNAGLFEVTPILPLAEGTLIEALERALGRNVTAVSDDS
jgi:hypothetical protein